ncbi:hypothetical protein [Deinococcus misasensis]|uniref:hypothetical protein n=1 Tax=Deinococcus misasensis TaxID=392413 RepID=UPI0005569BA7|nr:hypothetical protein [Deinococcus misasensis]
MPVNNSMFNIILVALAVFGIYSGYKDEGWSGALAALVRFGIPVLLFLVVMEVANRRRKRK